MEWTSRYEQNLGLGLVFTEVKPQGSTDMYWVDNADEIYYVLVPDKSSPPIRDGDLFATRADGVAPSSSTVSVTRALLPGDLFM